MTPSSGEICVDAVANVEPKGSKQRSNTSTVTLASGRSPAGAGTTRNPVSPEWCNHKACDDPRGARTSPIAGQEPSPFALDTPSIVKKVGMPMVCHIAMHALNHACMSVVVLCW